MFSRFRNIRVTFKSRNYYQGAQTQQTIQPIRRMTTAQGDFDEISLSIKSRIDFDGLPRLRHVRRCFNRLYLTWTSYMMWHTIRKEDDWCVIRRKERLEKGNWRRVEVQIRPSSLHVRHHPSNHFFLLYHNRHLTHRHCSRSSQHFSILCSIVFWRMIECSHFYSEFPLNFVQSDTTGWDRESVE